MGVEGNEYVMEEVYPGESAMCEGRREGKCACLVVICLESVDWTTGMTFALKINSEKSCQHFS